MQSYYNTILTSQGNGLVPFSNATINVYLTGTTTPAAIFSNNGVTAQSNPFQASVLGVVTFYAADGRYDIKISGVGFATVTVSDVLLEDPLNATSYIITGGSIDGTPIGATVKSTGGFTNITTTGQILLPDGVPGTPSLTFASYPAYGLYNNGGGRVNWCANAGTSIFSIAIDLSPTSNICMVFNANAYLGFNSAISNPATAPLDAGWTRDGAGIIAQKNAANAQEYRVYGTTTGPKYLSLKHDGTNAIVGANSGAINFGTGASITPQVQITDTPSAVNFHQFTGSATGGAINWAAVGSDANIGIRVAPKGNSQFLVDSGANAAGATLSLNCTGAGGVTIQMIGNGATTPNKYIRVFNGNLEFINSAYAAVIMSLSNTGALTLNANLSLSYNGTNSFVVTGAGQLAFNTAAIATTATTGFHCTVSGAGAPTGVPASIPSGQIPTYYDSTNNRIYFYNGAWRSVAVA